MRITIIGTGYVGLTTGACFAEIGHEVLCADIDEQKIAKLQQGILPIYEPGLEQLVTDNSKSGQLKFTTNNQEAIEFGQVIFSAVGTPPDANHKADLTAVKAVAKAFGQHLNEYKVFVNKSTVPVGTGNLCERIIQKELENRQSPLTFDAVSNPEFLREGVAVKDIFRPDRIIIGTESNHAEETMKKVYDHFIKAGTKVVFTDLKTAEIIKYASNAMLATRISFINEIANFCEKAGGDVDKVAHGMGLDHRIGTQFLKAGIGYGGSCFPKDVKALIASGQEYGYDFQIIKATEQVNESQKTCLINKLQNEIGPLKDKIIAIWGLAFKPETDDLREAPSLKIIQQLQELGAKIQAYDPVAKPQNLQLSETPYQALQDADALLILTEWQEFKQADLTKIPQLMQTPLVLDGRNIFQPEEMHKHGICYLSIGKQNSCSVHRNHATLKANTADQASHQKISHN